MNRRPALRVSAPVLAALAAGDGGQVVLRYAGANQNGSAEAIAGVANAAGNVVGLMPHPERAVDPLVGSTDGRNAFEIGIIRVRPPACRAGPELQAVDWVYEIASIEESSGLMRTCVLALSR